MVSIGIDGAFFREAAGGAKHLRSLLAEQGLDVLIQNAVQKKLLFIGTIPEPEDKIPEVWFVAVGTSPCREGNLDCRP